MENGENAILINVRSLEAVLSGRPELREGKIVSGEKKRLIVQAENLIPLRRIEQNAVVAEQEKEKKKREKFKM